MGTNFDDDQLENEFIIMGTTLNSVRTSPKIILAYGALSVVNSSRDLDSDGSISFREFKVRMEETHKLMF